MGGLCGRPGTDSHMSRPNPPLLEDLLDVCRLKYKTPNPEFVRLLKGLFSKALFASDEAFFELQSRAHEFTHELLTVFQHVRDELAAQDQNTGNWYYLALIDCIKYTSKSLTILYQELRHPHPYARQLAIQKLQEIGNHDKEARKILRNALKNEHNTPEETWEFREAVQKALRNED
jgi:hypothetical protein